MTRVGKETLNIVDCPRKNNYILEKEPDNLVKKPYNKYFCNSCGYILKTTHDNETHSFVAKMPGILDTASAVIYIYKPGKGL